MNFKQMEEASLLLSDCPFCGGRPVITLYSGSDTIFCGQCPAMMGGEESTVEVEDLILAWQARAALEKK